MESENPDANPAVIAGVVHIVFDGVGVAFDEIGHFGVIDRGATGELHPSAILVRKLPSTVVDLNNNESIAVKARRLDGKLLGWKEGRIRRHLELAVVTTAVIMVDVPQDGTRLDAGRAVGSGSRSLLYHSGAFSFCRERSRTQGQAENRHQNQSQSFLKITHKGYLHKTVASHICPLRITKVSDIHNEFATLKNTYVAGSNFNTLNNLCQ